MSGFLKLLLSQVEQPLSDDNIAKNNNSGGVFCIVAK
jgi:hypothetical protein